MFGGISIACGFDERASKVASMMRGIFFFSHDPMVGAKVLDVRMKYLIIMLGPRSFS